VSVAVVVPFTPGEYWRNRAWEAVQGHYAAHHPGWQLVTGTCDGAWVKALAVADALTKTDADTLVVADADVWTSPEALQEAVEQAQTHSCAIPHEAVHRLDEPATLAFYTGHWLPSYDRKPYVGIVGGGICVVRRDLYETCPMDPRFRGWGGEDVSWGLALWTLHGRWWRGHADLWHLYHPTARVGNVGGPESGMLATAYSRAFNRPDRMRAIIEEGKSCSPKDSSRTR
jgi:hypothetical protein